jgi:deoxyribodipyrimidine photo-lyase
VFDTGLVWLRRDLRTQDNAALNAALQHCRQVHCLFVFDRDILDPLPRTDHRLAFIRESLIELDQSLRSMADHPLAGLITCHGVAAQEVPAVAAALGAQAVFAARDYEPQAMARDDAVQQALNGLRIGFERVKDHVLFEQREVLTQAGTPYTVFTPYKRAWLARLQAMPAPPNAPLPQSRLLAPRPPAFCVPVPTLTSVGFDEPTGDPVRLRGGTQQANALLQDFLTRIDHYDQTRDFPAIRGPSYLGVHLRFGTLSIRQLVALANERSAKGSTGAATWLSELAWRDFYFQILANFPQVAQSAFKPAYNAIAWESGATATQLFAAWCNGQTGYPLVDAAMAQLVQSGYMHNRLRMVAGSFLVKHLGIDWRWGEQFFARHLMDFDLASNNGGWQWVSSSGCDAQPYFRVFNPVLQSRKFDPQGKFIRRYLPQLAALDNKDIHAPWLASAQSLGAAGVNLGVHYPAPVVDHALARSRTLQRYAVVRSPIETN